MKSRLVGAVMSALCLVLGLLTVLPGASTDAVSNRGLSWTIALNPAP